MRPNACHWRIINVDNGGPSRARNIGWRQAKGGWIQFLDADDLLAPEKFKIQMELARSVSKEVAVIYSDWQQLAFHDDKWRHSAEMRSPHIGRDALIDLLSSENFLQLGSQLIRRSWLERVEGFNESYWLIEDVDLLLRIAIAGGQFRRAPTSLPLFSYRRTAGSLSQRSQRDFVEGCIRNGKMVESYWRSEDALTPERAERLTAIYSFGARHFAALDKKRFTELVDQIEVLASNYCPASPRHLRYLSQFVGYRRAEEMAVLYRRWKQVARAAFSKVRPCVDRTS
jgi:glycosyltransferase involved in cell wall biosynthesis